MLCSWVWGFKIGCHMHTKSSANTQPQRAKSYLTRSFQIWIYAIGCNVYFGPALIYLGNFSYYTSIKKFYIYICPVFPHRNICIRHLISKRGFLKGRKTAMVQANQRKGVDIVHLKLTLRILADFSVILTSIQYLPLILLS